MLKYLKKYGYDLAFGKSELYKKINDHKDIIKKEGFDFRVKTIEELFKYEIIYHSIVNKNRIENAYNQLYLEAQDVLKYLNYEEKQKIFNGELESFIHNLPHFKEIYIPYLESFINDRYIHNYMMMILKQHHTYVQQYPKTIDKPYELYGYKPMISSFSSLIPIGKDETYYYFYHEEFKRIFVFYKNEYKLHDEIYLTDKYCKRDLDIKKVTQIVEVYCQDQNAFLDMLYQEKYISEKVYKKILKKIK